MIADSVLQRTRRLLASKGIPDFEKTHLQVYCPSVLILLAWYIYLNVFHVRLLLPICHKHWMLHDIASKSYLFRCLGQCNQNNQSLIFLNLQVLGSESSFGAAAIPSTQFPREVTFTKWTIANSILWIEESLIKQIFATSIVDRKVADKTNNCKQYFGLEWCW